MREASSASAPKQSEIDLSRAPLYRHLLELRRRLLYVLAFFCCAFAVSYYFAGHIYSFLAAPLRDAMGGSERHMIYTGLHEAFVTHLKLSLYSAFFFSIPLALNQLWKFLAPGLYHFERRSLRPFLILTPVLFVAGMALAYYLVFPMAWNFFLSFETPSGTGDMPVQLEARVAEYMSLVAALILAFGLSFELPMLLLLLARLGMIDSEDLTRYRKHAIVLIFAFAAIITPPDIISQIALGVPLWILYELSIVMIRTLGIDKPTPSAADVS